MGWEGFWLVVGVFRGEMDIGEGVMFGIGMWACVFKGRENVGSFGFFEERKSIGFLVDDGFGETFRRLVS